MEGRPKIPVGFRPLTQEESSAADGYAMKQLYLRETMSRLDMEERAAQETMKRVKLERQKTLSELILAEQQGIEFERRLGVEKPQDRAIIDGVIYIRQKDNLPAPPAREEPVVRSSALPPSGYPAPGGEVSLTKSDPAAPAGPG